MILREFIENLHKFVKENPETLDMQVITSMDDEGNGFNPITYTPSKGIYENKEFISLNEYKDWGRSDYETNAICIN